MRCIVATGLPNGPLERASNKRHRAVATGFHTGTRLFGRDEQRTVLTATGVVVQINRVLNEGPGKPACISISAKRV